MNMNKTTNIPTKATMPASRLRILCFHSFRLSGDSMRLQLSLFSNFRNTISDLVSFDYLDGGNRLPDEAWDEAPQMLRDLFQPPYYEWWNAAENTDGSMTYDHIEASFDKIEKHVSQHGPYDGYLGFSQGGCVAHTLSLLSLRDPAFAKRLPPPRFGIFISARTSRHTTHTALVAGAAQAPLSLPSLVIYGGKDTDMPAEMTEELMRTLDETKRVELYLPDGTHRIPRLDEAQAQVLREFLVAQLDAKQAM